MEERMTSPQTPDENPVEQYLQEIRRVPPLTEEEKTSLPLLAAKGDTDAIQRITESRLMLVYNIASHYHLGQGQMLDLLQEGNTALMNAAARFPWADYPDLEAFDRSVHRQIKMAVIREYQRIYSERRPPMINVAMVEAQYRLRKKLGRQPTIEELSEETGMPVEEIQSRIHACKLWETPEIQAEEEETHRLTKEKVQALLDTLPEREQDILRYRFGMEDGQTHTLEEASRFFGITRDRIRQIENRAIRRLRPRRSHYRKTIRLFEQDFPRTDSANPEPVETSGDKPE